MGRLIRAAFLNRIHFPTVRTPSVEQTDPKRKPIRPCVKVWLEMDGQYVFGFGLSEILKAVQATGSIKAAAQRLGKSYRYIWGRIKKAEKAIKARLVEARVGGSGASRSRLTPLATQLVGDYDALRERMFQVVDEEYSARFTPLTRS